MVVALFIGPTILQIFTQLFCYCFPFGHGSVFDFGSANFRRNSYSPIIRISALRCLPIQNFYFNWINFRVDKISRIVDRKFSRGLNFANQPVFHLIYFVFLGVLAKIAILKISRGQNFAKINPREI